MEFDEDKVFNKLERRIEKYIKEQRMLRKISDDYEVLEEVFDKYTLMALYELMNKGYIEEFYGVVSTGKEARIYSGIDRDGEEIAIKIFLTWTSEFRRGRMKYILGDKRFGGVYMSTRKLIYTWASKEYKNLKTAYDAGVYVPRPITYYKNIIIMEFIGKDFKPAPLLKEYRNISPHILYQILRQVRKLYIDAGLIHADLSEYNIFYFKRKPILFDFGQAVIKSHPQAETFLIRDISNILNFFRLNGIEVPSLDEVLEYIKGV